MQCTPKDRVLDPTSLKIWRGTLLFITVAECCILNGTAYWQGQFRPEISGVYGLIARNLPAVVILVGTTLFALARFLRPTASVGAGIVALLGMKLSGETFERVFAVHHQDFYQGGALLTGAVIGELYARTIGVRPANSAAEALEARRFGMTGALGMLAGSYVAAGTSKLLGGGLSWTTSSALRLMLLSHGEVEGNAWSTTIPQWTANSPYVCMALEVGTIIIQLGAVMLVLGPRARRLWAVLIVAFHAGIYLTSHILFLSPMLFATVVAIPWNRLLSNDAGTSVLPAEVKQAAARAPQRLGALAILMVAVILSLRVTAGW